jgi:hypothetical protein
MKLIFMVVVLNIRFLLTQSQVMKTSPVKEVHIAWLKHFWGCDIYSVRNVLNEESLMFCEIFAMIMEVPMIYQNTFNWIWGYHRSDNEMFVVVGCKAM